MHKQSRRAIDGFLAEKRIAFIGASRNPAGFSRKLFAELAARGYELVPVNPSAAEIDGRRCYPRVADIASPPRAALVMTPPGQAAAIVDECTAAGITKVWLYRAASIRAHDGVDIIAGECPYMFLPGVSWPHRLHGAIDRLIGLAPT